MDRRSMSRKEWNELMQSFTILNGAYQLVATLHRNDERLIIEVKALGETRSSDRAVSIGAYHKTLCSLGMILPVGFKYDITCFTSLGLFPALSHSLGMARMNKADALLYVVVFGQNWQSEEIAIPFKPK